MSGQRKANVAAEIDGWMGVTIPARQYVYSVLEREYAEAMRRSSELDLQACIEVGMRPLPSGQHVRVEESLPASNIAAQGQLMLADALAKALELIQDQDDQYCPDCDEIHLSEADSHPDSKDVS